MMLSRTLAGATTPSNGQNEHAEISSDGSVIARDSTAANLDPRANGKSQVYESANPFLTTTATPQLVSVSSDGTSAGDQPSTRPGIDRDCFVRGTAPGAVVGINTTIRVSVGYTGQQLTAAGQRPDLDRAGDKVGFVPNSGQVVAGDRNTQRDVFLRDLTAGTNYLIDACQTGGFGGSTTPCPRQTTSDKRGSFAVVTPMTRVAGEDLSTRPFLSDDGLTVTFPSGMSDLVLDDANASTSTDDIFVRSFSSD